MFFDDDPPENPTPIVKDLTEKGTAASFDANAAYGIKFGDMTAKIQDLFEKMVDAANPLDTSSFLQLEEYSNEIQRAFGMSKERMDEFKTSIADAAPELVKLGISESQVSGNLIAIMNSLGGAASLSKEAVVELSAAAELTGQNVGTLSQNFRDVGISVYDAGDEMKKVALVARAAGVSVSEVSLNVMTNLEKMNLYNFENGTKGLAKMSAQAVRLGLDMQNVFTQMEKAFNPEGAIDMAASLQRLGVTTSGLLDPLRAMDMASNDPEQFQKEIVNLGKEFTRFNEKTGQMEILPGAKRRMREVAVAVGMTGDEFAKMALKSADFDMKLKQIKMPSFGVEDEETKEMIATMAQMKDGVATIQVRDKDTGITSEKNVEELSPEDIENLKQATEDSSKSIEQLAFDQLDVQKQILNTLATGEVATKFAKATTPTLSKFYGVVADSKLEIAKGFENQFGDTKTMRGYTEKLANPLEDVIAGQVTGDVSRRDDGVERLKTGFFEVFKDFSSSFSTEVNEVQKALVDKFQTAYTKPMTVETKSSTTADVTLNLKSDGLSAAQLAVVKQEILDDPEFRAKFLVGPLVSASTGGKNK